MKKLAGMLVGLAFFLCAVAAQAQCTLGEGLGAPDLTWTTGGATDWFCVVDGGPVGDAAQSGATGDNQTSWLETTVNYDTAKILSFYWRVDSEQDRDYLRFYINGSEYSAVSGNPVWAQVALSLSAGTTYTLRWEYVKDTSGAAGLDFGRVAEVNISDPPVTDLLEHYGEMYATPSIPTPLFAKNTVAKAQPDECYDNGMAGEPDESGNCASGEPKTNQAYVWGLARSGNLWFGTAANVLCLVMSIMPTGPVEAPNFVCEFDEADNATNRLGDWRPPQIWEYNPDTMALTDRTPLDMIANPTLGLRSAGALDGVVLLAGPSFDGDAVNVFAFADDGTYLGMDVLSEYNNIRQWIVYEGVMYTGVSTTGGEGRILRWNGDSSDPFQFEVVGKLDLDAANLAVHEGRLFSTTWPSLGMTGPTAGGLMGLWMSPVIPEAGLTGSDNDTWQKVWSVSNYEPDLLVRRTYGGGALASYDGMLFWGTMHVPFIATQAAISAYQNSLINLGGYDNSFGADDIAATALGTHRAVSIFSGRDFGTPGQTIELLYGDEYLPRYEPAARSYTIAEDNFHRNLMPNPVPKWGPSGIGNFFNAYTWTMDLGFDDYPSRGGVLLGTFDWSLVAREMAEVVLGDSTQTEFLLAVIDQLQRLYASYGADLFVIQGADEPFVLESKNGAGNEFSYGIRTMLIPDTGAPVMPAGDAPAADGECQHGYLGMANPFNLADEGGWELVDIYPLPEVEIVTPSFQELVQGDVVLQAQDLSACPLSNVVFYVTNIYAQVSTYPATYNPATGMWEYVLGTASLPVANGIYTVSALGTDDKGAVAPAVVVPFVINNDCVQDSECDDGLWCTGTETCNETQGVCAMGISECSGGVCDEDNDTCVECLANPDCGTGFKCEATVCVVDCILHLKYKTISAAKLTKPMKRSIEISGSEGFNNKGQIDIAPFTWQKASYNNKKNRVTLKVTVPAGLAPGNYPISVGGCVGEITVL